VGYKQIKNPQRHLVILCFLFETAALAGAIYSILEFTNNHDEFTTAAAILSTVNNNSFCLGHWKFVWQFFIGAIETKSILWNGISWHLEKVSNYRVPLDWGVSAFIIISFLGVFLT
jgi:hypothetical protein